MKRLILHKDSIKLYAAETDVAVSRKDIMDVLSWCFAMGIKVEVAFTENQEQHLAKKKLNVDIWRIKDDQQRLMFLLKWA